MPTAHLVHGYLGAGKTTFSRKLERDLPAAVRFSPDEWLPVLYGAHLAADRLVDAFERACRLTSDTWPRVLRTGADVILDLGFWRRSLRDEARRRAAALGSTVVLYSLSCDESIARERCHLRHGATNGTFALVDLAFDALHARFEELGPDEPCVALDTSLANLGEDPRSMGAR